MISFQHVEAVCQYARHMLQAVGLVEHLKDRLAVLHFGDEMSGEQIGHVPGLASGPDVVGGFGRNLTIEARVLAEHVGKLVHESGSFPSRSHLFR